jgi:hypothetical protein
VKLVLEIDTPLARGPALRAILRGLTSTTDEGEAVIEAVERALAQAPGAHYSDAEVASAYRRAKSVKGAARLLNCARATVRAHLDRMAIAHGVADPAPANDDGAEALPVAANDT